jgi:hypothetical protein
MTLAMKKFNHSTIDSLVFLLVAFVVFRDLIKSKFQLHRKEYIRWLTCTGRLLWYDSIIRLFPFLCLVPPVSVIIPQPGFFLVRPPPKIAHGRNSFGINTGVKCQILKHLPKTCRINEFRKPHILKRIYKAFIINCLAKSKITNNIANPLIIKDIGLSPLESFDSFGSDSGGTGEKLYRMEWHPFKAKIAAR